MLINSSCCGQIRGHEGVATSGHDTIRDAELGNMCAAGHRRSDAAESCGLHWLTAFLLVKDARSCQGRRSGTWEKAQLRAAPNR